MVLFVFVNQKVMDAIRKHNGWLWQTQENEDVDDENLNMNDSDANDSIQ